MTLIWKVPESDGRSALTGYEVRIDRAGDWISTGSTDLTYTVTGLTNGRIYVFEVRAVNEVGQSPPSDDVEATPMAEEVIWSSPISATGFRATTSSSPPTWCW